MERVSIIRVPEPQDFDIYFPYACRAMQLPELVYISRQLLNDYVASTSTKKSKAKQKGKSRTELSSEKTSEDDNHDIFTQHFDGISIHAYYDNHDNLLQLKFLKNKKIPSAIFELLSLLIHFYVHLNSITIDRGLNSHNLKVLHRVLLLSNVTDLCLDGACILSGDYHILLENTKLKQLSLSRCNIDDVIIEKICLHLHYPEINSESLSVLNLATNKITDTGARYLASALRSNRCLSYLNLSDNRITDDGGIAILDSLTEFIMTTDEFLAGRRRDIMHLREREQLIAKYLEEGINNEAMIKPTKKKKLSKSDNLTGGKRDDVSDEIRNYEIAAAKADEELGVVTDPFSSDNIIFKNELNRCKGNAKLCNLNLAYNNLSLIFVNHLIKVLKYQKDIEKKYTGLLILNIEGNCLPLCCAELQCASDLLHAAVSSYVEKPKKKI